MKLLHLLALLTLFSCSDKDKAQQTNVARSTKTTTDTMEPPVALSDDKPISTKAAPAGAVTWTYAKTTDKEGHSVYKASITSPKLLEFGFPYAGGSIATLTIRKRESGTHVYIQVSKGQFNRSFQEGKAHVRFDENPAITYSFSAAENGSANIIFFDSDQALINKMKAARNMTVDVDFAGQGKRLIEFQTAGLVWNH
ncbi:hypothetical protein EXU85_06000 [Spirosoma sp. KCTC 42546]|uniref:hypothetical protein n=1 Tax=Spirosoma sp. KCTC 42546 TaxID=2520506 RepID=UPI00115A2902|nr:hypothetical protein [Spirosoma sp. KCTC 42546]QDK78172.1 hypothetical protein EXU85_06000 [Spirosoma sp. KCTC 42546]